MAPVTASGIYQRACCIFVLSAGLSLTACAVGAAWQKTPTPTVDSLPVTSVLPAGMSPAAPIESPSQIPLAVSTQFPLTVISTPPIAAGDTEALVLKQVGELIPMCPPDFGSNTLFISGGASPARFRLECGVGWGHVSDVEIRRYDSSVDAQSALADILGDLPAQDFHGRPAIEWRCFAQSYANCWPSGGVERGMLHRNHCWQADRWLTCAHAFDDIGWEFASDPLKISEAVYQAFVEHSLLPKIR